MAEVNRRLKVLMLADKLGSVSEACAQMEFSKTQFYLYKKRYEAMGLEGLKMKQHDFKHPHTTSEVIQVSVKNLSIAHPEYGAQHLTEVLKSNGIKIAPATVHKILKENNLASRKSRWIFLENLRFQDADILTETQWQFLQKMNPCHLEVLTRGAHPGASLVQDCFSVIRKKEIKIFLHFIIDTYSNMVFAKIDQTMSPLPAMQLLQEKVLPFYATYGVTPSKIYTHNGRTFKGNKSHDYELMMRKYKIDHSLTHDGHSHGFSKHFKNVVANELQITENSDLLENWQRIDTEIQTWIHHYNHRRASFGYPNFSRFPIELHETGGLKKQNPY